MSLLSLLFSVCAFAHEDEEIDGQNYGMMPPYSPMMGGGFNMGMPSNYGYAMRPMMGSYYGSAGGYGGFGGYGGMGMGGSNAYSSNMGMNNAQNQGNYNQGNTYSSSTAWDKGNQDVHSHSHNQGSNANNMGNQYGSSNGYNSAYHRLLSEATVNELPALPSASLSLMEPEEMEDAAPEAYDDIHGHSHSHGYEPYPSTYGGGGGSNYPPNYGGNLSSSNYGGNSSSPNYGGNLSSSNYGGAGYSQGRQSSQFMSPGTGYGSYQGGAGYGSTRPQPRTVPGYSSRGGYPQSSSSYPVSQGGGYSVGRQSNYPNSRATTGSAIASGILSSIFRNV